MSSDCWWSCLMLTRILCFFFRAFLSFCFYCSLFVVCYCCSKILCFLGLIIAFIFESIAVVITLSTSCVECIIMLPWLLVEFLFNLTSDLIVGAATISTERFSNNLRTHRIEYVITRYFQFKGSTLLFLLFWIFYLLFLLIKRIK